MFTYVNAKFPGATHDSGIWSTSEVREHFLRIINGQQQSWLIGDQGYPLEPWLMTPITNPTTNQERKYNKIHASARNCIERAFGVLKTRFRCLSKHRVLHYTHETAADIINCCVILHNIMLKAGYAIDVDISEITQQETVAQGNTSNFDRGGGRIRQRYISTLDV